MISIVPWFAAVIFMLTDMRSCWVRPIFVSSAVPAKHDWHPVSAMALKVMGRVDNVVGEPRDLASEGTARIVTLMKGWGSEERFSHALQNSL